jgi:Leucine-rich repeat (LRR) protein
VCNYSMQYYALHCRQGKPESLEKCPETQNHAQRNGDLLLKMKLQDTPSISPAVHIICLFIVTVIPWIRTGVSECVGSISNEEYSGLQALYVSTGGENWNWKTTDPTSTQWYFPSSTSTPCGNSTWQGLVCNATLSANGASCSVSEIRLREYGLHGTLPSDVALICNATVFDVSDNQIYGPIPGSLRQMTSLSTLKLNNNRISGNLGTELSSLRNLKVFTIGHNLIVGSLSQELFLNLTSLEYFSVGTNDLSSTMPSSMGSLKNLTYLDVTYNSLSGIIPIEIYNLMNLETFIGYNNMLSGSLSTQFGKLLSLKWLELDYNNIWGSIATEFGLLHDLEMLNLESNVLSSTIPLQLFGLYGLDQLILNTNYLSGKIDSSIQQLTELQVLELATNALSGPLPSEMSALNESLWVLFLAHNMYSGAIPEVLYTLTALQYLYVQANSFTGTLSTKIGYLSNLINLDLAANRLSSEIPTEFYALTEVKEVALAHNYFSGSILASLLDAMANLNFYNNFNNLFTGSFPSVLGSLAQMRSFDIHKNYFSGFIELSFNESSGNVLESLEMGYNFFSGTLSAQFEKFQVLVNINGSFNLFSGNMNDVFNSENTLQYLQYLDFSANAITGNLPVNLFVGNATAHIQRSLSAVVLYSNCFTGSLPASMCHAGNLSVLILDSASSAPACDIHFPKALQPIFKVVIGKRTLGGSIPDCLWSMPNLKTLHLSGNGLVGNLEDLSDSQSPVLNDVSLASNRLSGTLPLSWQQWPWRSLDLSGNKLMGTLSSVFTEASNCSNMDLSSNRLSGYVPTSLHEANNVNILEGNLFQCDSEDMPVNDPNSKQYICGSEGLNDALVTWGILLGAMLLFGGLKFKRSLDEWLLKFEELHVKANAKTLPKVFYVRSFLLYLRNVFRLCVCLTILFVLGSMVSYIALKKGEYSHLYSTHSEQYAWVTTAAYLHGAVPGSLIMIFLFGSKLCIAAVLSANIVAQPKPRPVRMIDKAHRASILRIPMREFLHKYLAVIVIITAHVCVLIVVNVAYVYFLITGLSPAAMLFLQLSLSVFKLLWNMMYINPCLRRFAELDNDLAVICSSFMVLFTFVASPVIATFMSDTTCFRYFITGQPSVSSTFQCAVYYCTLVCYTSCSSVCQFSDYNSNTCYTSVTPSWQYSYQCSSSLLINYTPVLIFSFALSGVVMPVLRGMFMWMSASTMEKYIPSALLAMMDNTIHSHRKSLAYTRENARHQHVKTVTVDDATVNVIKRGAVTDGHEHGQDSSHIILNLNDKGLDFTDTNNNKAVLLPFSGVGVVSKVCVNVGIMLTFGLASPLLAVAICVESIATYVLWQCLITRYIYIHLTDDVNDDEKVAHPSDDLFVRNAMIAEADIPVSLPQEKTNSTRFNPFGSVRIAESKRKKLIDVDEAWQRLHHSTNVITAIPVVMWMVIVMAGLFWGLFIFDMFGDVYGRLYGACMVLVPTVGGIVVYWSVLKATVLYRRLYDYRLRTMRTSLFNRDKYNIMVLNDLHTPIIEPRLSDINEDF